MIKSCEKIQNYGLVKLLKVSTKVFHKLLEEFLDFCFIVAKISNERLHERMKKYRKKGN